MTRRRLILDRYEPLGTAGVGGFGTVEIAWDPRIQRKVAIKTIPLTELDAIRAKLPGAQGSGGPAPVSAAERWRGALPWEDEPARDTDPQATRALDLPIVDQVADTASPAAASQATRALDIPAIAPGHNDFPSEEKTRALPVYEADVQAGKQHDVAAGQTIAIDGNEASAIAIPNAEDALTGKDEPERSDDKTVDPVTSLAHLPGLDEARTAAMLHDPRIVTVYDFEVRDRTAYLIMEYVEGITLARLLDEYPDSITLDMVTAVFDAVAGALMTAHDAGVLHLDIKPDNIIITPQGQSKVTDFGLATLADASGAGTTGGGTIGYMPLEQMRREHLDARTDEWSLAALTYEMLTGANPFKAPTLAEAERAIEEAELVLPSLCWADIDEQIDDVVFYALDPNREERYATVADFAEEMDKFLGDSALGEDDLADAVMDALGMFDEQEEEIVEEAIEQPATPRPRHKAMPGATRETLRTVFPGLATQSIPARSAADDYPDYADDEYYDDYQEPTARYERKPHEALKDSVNARTLNVLARAFAAATSGGLSLVAAANMPFLGLTGFAPTMIAIVVGIACAVGAFIKPGAGSLVSLCLLGLSFAACGHPVPAAIVIVATGLWWYAVGHEGIAATNAALLFPLAGAIGGAAGAPLIAGAALKPIQAVLTTALSAAVMLMLASLGSNSIEGWNAFVSWDYVGVNITGNLVALAMQPRIWAEIAGWIAASAAVSLLASRGGRPATIAGVACGVALVVAGAMVFATPTPQLIVSVVVAAAALIAVTI